jgi:hypothetical protein
MQKSDTNLEYIGLPELLRIKKCFFLFLHDIEASSCTSVINQAVHNSVVFDKHNFVRHSSKSKIHEYATDF